MRGNAGATVGTGAVLGTGCTGDAAAKGNRVRAATPGGGSIGVEAIGRVQAGVRTLAGVIAGLKVNVGTVDFAAGATLVVDAKMESFGATEESSTAEGGSKMLLTKTFSV